MSSSKDFKWMLQYLEMLDVKNAKILEGLGKHGPRNTLLLARSICVPNSTVRFRLKKLTEKAFFWIHGIPDYSKLGLMTGILYANAPLKRKETLRKAILNTLYWVYIVDCYGKYDGAYVTFAFPAKYRNQLKQYIDEMVRLGIISDYFFFWTTNLLQINPNFSWFNFNERKWDFRWQDWIDETRTASDKLPEELAEPKAFDVTVDEPTLLILKELEKDGTADFTSLAKVAKISRPAVAYRYKEHVLKRKLITDYQVAIFPYPPETSEVCSFLIDFKNEEALARFVNSIQNKPFARVCFKTIGQNSIVLDTYTPKAEFPNLLESLNKLVIENVVKHVFYVSLDLDSFNRQTVSYEHFKNGKWTYDHQERLEKLKELIKK